MYTLTPARMEELERCLQIIEDGRAFQQEQGFTQWTEDYPSREILRQDIESGKGYAVRQGQKVAGYLCLDFDGEPAYREIQGQWRSGEPYAVVHRMAFSREFRGKGLTGTAFGLIEQLCREAQIRFIRVDTDFPNRRMQHLLVKNGFVKCGIVVFQGSGKLAYDKILAP